LKRILFVTGNLDRGGAQRVLSLLANYYAAEGTETHVAMLLNNTVGYDIHPQIILHDLSCQGSYIKNAFRMIRKLKSAVIEIKPEIVVSFAGRVNLITMLAAKNKGIPILVSERNDPLHDRRNRIERWLCKRSYGKADKVVFQTKYQSKVYEKTCKKNSVIIGNPIAAPVYEGEHIKKDIVCVGKLMDQKNHPMMIRAFARLANEFPDKQVFIYGDGPKHNELQELINELRMSDRIHLCGNTDKIFDVLHEYQYFVMCSNYEGMSNALLEAMISGMVCVTTNWNGVEEIVTDGVNGYLIPVGNEDCLVRELRIVFNSYNERLTREAIESARQFTPENVIHIWNNTIVELAKEGKVEVKE